MTPNTLERTGTRAGTLRVALAVFVAALVVRLVVLAVHPHTDDGDQRLYRTLAKSLATGAGFVVDNVPGTDTQPAIPILVAIASWAVPDFRFAGMIVTLVIGALVPALAFWVIGSSFGLRAGLLAGAILALQPHHALASARLEPDLLSVALGFVLAALLVRGRFGWAGVVVALGYWNRPEAALWLFAVVVWAKWRGAAWRSLFLVVLVAITLAAPLLVFVRWHEGRWALAGKDRWNYMLGVHQYRSGGEGLSLDRARELLPEVGSPLEHLQARPQEFVNGYAYRSWILVKNIGRQTGYGLLVPFAVLGLVVGWRRQRGATLALLVPLVTVPFLPVVVSFFRHSTMPAAVVLALAGVGIAATIDRFDSARKVAPAS